MSKLATVVNIASDRKRFEIGTVAGAAPQVHNLEPGGTAEIAAGYTVRRGAEGRDPIPSIIEQLTNGDVVPASDARAQAVLERKAAEAKASADAKKGPAAAK